jgi:hypothetical protein
MLLKREKRNFKIGILASPDGSKNHLIGTGSEGHKNLCDRLSQLILIRFKALGLEWILGFPHLAHWATLTHSIF